MNTRRRDGPIRVKLSLREDNLTKAIRTALSDSCLIVESEDNADLVIFSNFKRDFSTDRYYGFINHWNCTRDQVGFPDNVFFMGASDLFSDLKEVVAMVTGFLQNL